MKQPALRTVLGVLVAIFGSGSLVGSADRSAGCEASVAPQAQRAVVDAENHLGFSLLGLALRGPSSTSSKDVFLSPFSIEQALGVVYLGARGATAQAFVKASIVPPASAADFACASKSLRADLPTTSSGVTLDFANALWIRQGFTLKTAFVDAATAAFGTNVRSLNFASPDALRTINAWVNDRTRGHIPTILNRLDAAEAIVTNAVYFKGSWQQAFEKSQTATDQFFGAGRTTRVPFMNRTASFSYYEGPGFQFVRLPYRGDRFAMYVLLPDKGKGLRFTEAASSFAKALAHAAPRRVDLLLPKLHLNYETNLVGPLTDLGLGVAFSDSADFAAISDERLKISSVVHKTTLDVDEAGTTATAATGVVMETTARYDPHNPVVVKVDRPFLCMIRDDRSGAVLFIGAIHNVGAK